MLSWLVVLVVLALLVSMFLLTSKGYSVVIVKDGQQVSSLSQVKKDLSKIVDNPKDIIVKRDAKDGVKVVSYEADPKLTNTGGRRVTISMDEYKILRMGMKPQTVFDIIGGDGDILMRMGTEGTEQEMVMIQFEADNGFLPGANAVLTFQGGVLSKKEQYGMIEE